MNNIHLTILGSLPFIKILDELDFSNILNTVDQQSGKDKQIEVKILFVEDLKIKDVKNYLLINEPIILFLKNKDFIKRNNLNLLDFHVSLELPIEILSFKEILNILITKYNFFKKSKIIIKKYEIDSNESIWKHSLDLDTHAFETHLHRLRKKINKNFNDKNFIIEKNSLYYLIN